MIPLKKIVVILEAKKSFPVEAASMLCPGATGVSTTLQRWLFDAAEPHHVCSPPGQKSEKSSRLPSQYIPPQKPWLTT